MTSTLSVNPPATRSATHDESRSGPPSIRPARRRLLTVVGALLIVIGALAAAAGGGLIAVFGSAGALDSGPFKLSTGSAALVTDVAQIQNTGGVGAATGWPTLQLSASGGNSAGVFVGIGRADAVDRYLAGVPVDVVTGSGPRAFDGSPVRQSGSRAAAAPGEQSFWVASASSTSLAELSWPVADGDYRFVVMNADGTTNLTARTQVKLVLPNAFPISVLGLVVGGLVGAAGLGTVARAVSGTRSR